MPEHVLDYDGRTVDAVLYCREQLRYLCTPKLFQAMEASRIFERMSFLPTICQVEACLHVMVHEFDAEQLRLAGQYLRRPSVKLLVQRQAVLDLYSEAQYLAECVMDVSAIWEESEETGK